MKTLTRSQFLAMFGLWILALIASGIGPKDRATWYMEVAPVLIAMPILWFTRTSFPLPRYIMLWIFIHGLVLMLGGHYTYAEVPLGYWLKDVLSFERNPYDRIGHLMQGFVPALVAREILMRKNIVRDAAWLFFITVTICMSISVVYEFLEWWAALIMGEGADSFLGTQGDQWDTQWDMFLASLGAVAAQLVYRYKA